MDCPLVLASASGFSLEYECAVQGPGNLPSRSRNPAALLSGAEVSVDDAFDGLSKQSLPEIGIALRARLDGFFEVVRKRHYWLSCFFRRLYWPSIPAQP